MCSVKKHLLKTIRAALVFCGLALILSCLLPDDEAGKAAIVRVAAINGRITVLLAERPLRLPVQGDFEIRYYLDGAAAEEIPGLALERYAAEAKSVYFVFPPIPADAAAHDLQISVKLGSAETRSPAFTIPAAGAAVGLDSGNIANIYANNGRIAVVLNNNLTNDPVIGDFTVRQFIDGSEAPIVNLQLFDYDIWTKTITLSFDPVKTWRPLTLTIRVTAGSAGERTLPSISVAPNKGSVGDIVPKTQTVTADTAAKKLYITLEEDPTETPTAADFVIRKIVNGGEPHPVNGMVFAGYNNTTRTASYDFEILPTGAYQTVSITVAAAGDAPGAVTASAPFNVAADVRMTDEDFLSPVRGVITSGVVPNDALASSNQPGDDPFNAIDRNIDTIWHSRWDPPASGPHWIEFYFPITRLGIGAMYYMHRPGGNNGDILGYQVYVSSSAMNDTLDTDKLAASGTFVSPYYNGSGLYDEPARWQQAVFDDVFDGQYVQLRVLTNRGDGSFADVAEIKFDLFNAALFNTQGGFTTTWLNDGIAKGAAIVTKPSELVTLLAAANSLSTRAAALDVDPLKDIPKKILLQKEIDETARELCILVNELIRSAP